MANGSTIYNNQMENPSGLQSPFPRTRRREMFKLWISCLDDERIKDEYLHVS